MRVLLVEDDPRIAANIIEFLGTQSFAVDHTDNGKTGYEMAVKGDLYDAVISDRMLPLMDGATMVRNLRSEGVKTPIIMLTAMDATDQKIDGLYAGADDYLVKPFSLKELLARLHALLRRTFDHLEDGKELIIADLHLMLDTKQVYRANTAIKLSKKQFELLEYLMRNP